VPPRPPRTPSPATFVFVDRSRRQLDVLRELADVLGGARIRFWLRGGWALDFHLGEVRPGHADIDVVTRLRHRGRVRRLLTARGFSVVPGYREPQLVLEKLGEEVSFLFVVRRGEQLIVPGYEDWPLQPGALPDVAKTLAGVTSRVVSVEELLDEKLLHHQWSGRALRPKDRDSIALLRGLARRL